jgi:CRISPR-associated protein Cmr3
MIIRMKAIDTLFFRDGRPFTMGADTAASGLFPPSPGVLYGAIRSTYASKHGLKATDIASQTSNLRISDFRFFDRQSHQFYFPAPLDLVSDKEEAISQAFLLDLKKIDEEKIYSNYPFSYVLTSDQPVNSLAGKMLSRDSLLNYLSGQSNKFDFISMEDFLITEPKTGIARDRQLKISKEGHLYRVNFLRIPDLEIELACNFSDQDFTPIVRLGGEGKMARLQKLPYQEDHPDVALSVELDRTSKTFKLILQTPSFFHQGFEPDFKRFFPKMEIQVLAAAIGKKQAIGGFDMVNRIPKP